MEPADLTRIALVTRRFGDLQGLRTVFVGAMLLVGAVAASFVPASDPFLQVVLFAHVGAAGFVNTLNRFYQERFGSAPPRSTSDVRGLRPIQPYAVLPAIVMIGLLVGGLATPIGVLRFALGPALLTGCSLWIVVRDWPHRAHYTIGVVSGLVSLAMMLSAPAGVETHWLIDPAFAGTFTVACSIIGLALVAVGLIDHRFLTLAMCRHTASPRHPAVDAAAFAKPRMLVAGSAVVAVLGHVVLAGWPTEPHIAVGGMWLSMVVMMMIGALVDLRLILHSQHRALASAREARLLRRFTGAAADDAEADASVTPSVPPPDFWGHLALPIATACGALIDISLRGSGYPSAMAMALAASHAWIAFRDWPVRRHFVLGAAAAIVSTVQHMVLAPLDWAIWFLILFGTTTLIEGALDYSLQKKARHANAI